MWHQSCQRCKYTTSVEIQKRAKKKEKKLVTRYESHASAVSLPESGEWRCIKMINNNMKMNKFIDSFGDAEC